MNVADLGTSKGPGVGALLPLLALATVALFVRAWVASSLWLWFVSEPFGVFALPVPHMAGLLFLKSAVLFRIDPKETPETTRSTAEWVVVCTASMLFALTAYGVGAICAAVMA